MSGDRQRHPKWDRISFVISSSYRVAILDRLADGPATPSRIAADQEVHISHISRELQRLRPPNNQMVELLVPEDQPKSRQYGLSEQGAAIWSELQTHDLVEA